MRTRGRRWRIGAAVAALAVVVSVVAIGLSGGQGSSSGSGASISTAVGSSAVGSSPVASPGGSTSTTTLDPAGSAADVAAARACQAFTVYLDDAQKGRIPAAVGQALVSAAAALLTGSQQDQAEGRALPPWAALGSDLLAAAEDVVAKKSAALTTDGAAAGAQCRRVPVAAAQAGGFQRGG